MYRIGMSSCGFPLTEENFIKLAQSGISAIEISMAADKHASINFKEVKELSERYNIELWSYHLPFSPFSEIDVSSLNKELRDNAVKRYTDMIEKAADIGINKFIVHPSGEPIAAEEREERIKYSMQTLDHLAELAHRHGAVIAVEDLPRTCLGNTADEILRLISANDKLRVCFDTNHLLSDTNLNFIDKLGKKIITTHVSDYDFTNEKHWLPGEGSVDWTALYDALKNVGYNGVWLYELGLRPPKTLARSRDLTFDDFVCNANSIFNGMTPERVK
ncbi:MAG: sugar phosphate isomerase/epimerase [Ruminococcaceae bacterium]|nr:sugar phosphate isomerase/epimerase [Oscillospiraceae bacterium]